jgi:hypothetical protein
MGSVGHHHGPHGPHEQQAGQTVKLAAYLEPYLMEVLKAVKMVAAVAVVRVH